jgi:diaminopimelate dehydrogenase
VTRRNRIAVIGFGRLGKACIEALQDNSGLELAGVVRRPTSPARLAPPFAQARVARHIRDLEPPVHAALLCVPAELATALAREMLQMRIPLVECAQLEGRALEAHYTALENAATQHRVAAVVGAGWDPGVLPLVRHAFEFLVPRGETELTLHPAASLHHTATVNGVREIKAALAGEYRSASGAPQRYLYVELARGAQIDKVKTALASDPAFAGEETLVFPVESIAAIEDEGHGIVLTRRGSAKSGAHQSLLLEGRFAPVAFAARAMLEGAAQLPGLRPGAHRFALRG